MPKKAVKKRTTKKAAVLKPKATSKLRAAFYIVIGISLILFGAVLVIFRSGIKDISKDPSLFSLNNDAAVKVVQIINRNKNTHPDNLEGCWNLKNPFSPCTAENVITQGNYTLHGGEGGYWFEGPHKDIFSASTYEMPEQTVRDILGGFMLADRTYYQLIEISYPNSHIMKIQVETRNDLGDSELQTINLEGYPVTLLEPNE